ncbi:MAG: hypothetical protein JRM78_03635 [Nitrososphaerota archaeon]|nr:hypothetical protein [Nitrososphaerota archaeon]
MEIYKVPIYYNGEYVDSLEYTEPVSTVDSYRLQSDAIDILGGEQFDEIHVGTYYGHLAVFVRG